MSIKKAILIELEREKENTKRIISRLKNEHFSYKPHEKSNTLGVLANHIVELHNWVDFVLTKDTFDFHTDYQQPKLSSVEELLQTLEADFLKNKAIIEQMDETVVFENWTLKAGDHVIVSLPKTGALRFLVTNHLVHHRGQLTVYMRLLDIPVPGVYGPSADDKA
ncbi:DinB family protein [Paenimyroides aestuarii]|uniref:DinB family protein n=1 Tax=Paenimyroides aestuarii TaxID=2968490 RepID=A0ABY5NTD3_9FLAO|nr:DinB family protein [Paenimyroides aestuarii]UUV21832.1 DinB family protein [Paenimyroides aestuarii]